MKRLNALRHQRNSHEKKLEALQTEYNQLVTEAEEVSNTDAGESAEAQVRVFRSAYWLMSERAYYNQNRNFTSF